VRIGRAEHMGKAGEAALAARIVKVVGAEIEGRIARCQHGVGRHGRDRRRGWATLRARSAKGGADQRKRHHTAGEYCPTHCHARQAIRPSMMSPAAAVIGRCCENYWRLLHACPGASVISASLVSAKALLQPYFRCPYCSAIGFWPFRRLSVVHASLRIFAK